MSHTPRADELITEIEDRSGAPIKNVEEVKKRVMETGMTMQDIQKMSTGFASSMIPEADPVGVMDGGTFVGKVKRAGLGKNPSGYLRLITFTFANPSVTSFTPIPLNCSNFLTIYTSNYSYTVK